MSPSSARGAARAAPTLALCVPAYNAAWCLPTLLDGARRQTVPFDEVVVYDDCSSDDTAAVAERWGARVLRGEANVGCSTAKNRMAAAVACDWIHFHDADDEMLPNLVEVAHRWMQRDDAPDVVLLRWSYRYSRSGPVHVVPEYDAGLLRRDPRAFVLSHKTPNFGLYRRDAFLRAGGFNTDPLVLYNEDDAGHQRLALAGLRFDAEAELTCLNVRHPTSMSADVNRAACVRAEYHVLCEAVAQYPAAYRPLVLTKIWATAAYAARLHAWDTASDLIKLARRVGGRRPAPTAGSAAFRTVASIAPGTALRIREALVRNFRPHVQAP